MLQKKTVLVADDDLPILEVINIILQEKGYEVITVSDARAIEKTLKENAPDLILLDIWLSGQDGRDVTKRLRSNKGTRDIPIVFISAQNNVQKIAAEAGADGYLEKPFDIDHLVAVVEQYTN